MSSSGQLAFLAGEQQRKAGIPSRWAAVYLQLDLLTWRAAVCTTRNQRLWTAASTSSCCAARYGTGTLSELWLETLVSAPEMVPNLRKSCLCFSDFYYEWAEWPMRVPTLSGLSDSLLSLAMLRTRHLVSNSVVRVTGRRVLGLVNLDSPSVLVSRETRQSKWDVITCQWSSLEESRVAVASNNKV